MNRNDYLTSKKYRNDDRRFLFVGSKWKLNEAGKALREDGIANGMPQLLWYPEHATIVREQILDRMSKEEYEARKEENQRLCAERPSTLGVEAYKAMEDAGFTWDVMDAMPHKLWIFDSGPRDGFTDEFILTYYTHE